jgi:serine protease
MRRRLRPVCLCATLLLLAALGGPAIALPPPASGETPPRGGPAGPREPLPADESEPARPAGELFALGPFPPRPSGPTVAQDHVIVRFAESLPGWQRRQLAEGAGGTSFKVARMGSFVKVGVAAGDSVEGLVERLRQMPGVVLAEPDPILWGLAVEVRAAADKRTFSDPLAFLQWSYLRIRLPEALDLNSTDGDGVIVAVIDSGVASGDGTGFPARRGLDLEGTRFLPGADFVDGGPPFDEGVRTGSSATRFGHGTFAASQIAATVNNGISGGSVASRVTILPVRVIGTDNRAFGSDIVDGIDFAVAQGARVINLSLGGPQGADILAAAVARAHAAGVVIVAAAGNEAQIPGFAGDVSFPARYPEVLAVGSTAFSDLRASYSNFGPGLDLTAPAGESPTRIVGDMLRDAAVAPSFLFDPVSGSALYATFFATGTSFAAPQVAGGVALLAALGVDDPEAIRVLLTTTARDLGAPGRDNDTGEGLLDLLDAHRGLGFGF